MYHLLRPLIFALPPELAHRVAIQALRSGMLPAATLPALPRLQQSLWGIEFSNPVGMAAGFDKNADVPDALSKQGFGYVECGTVTPLAQAGNPAPRVFRLTAERALINRLGFNNDGLETYVANLAKRRSAPIVGGNIGKNKTSTDALADYVTCLRRVYPLVEYITVNISSPNTPGLRDLQAEDALRGLVRALYAERAALMAAGQPHKPMLVKIAPDLDDAAIALIADVALQEKIDGLIVSNTTLARPNINSAEQGGLSGPPLMPISTRVLADIARATKGQIPLVGVGGISSAEDAYEKILHGASLVQLYTALVYQGFGLAREIVTGLDALLARDGFSNIRDVVGKKL